MTLPPELIEKLRQTGIRLDREGRFWHEGQEVTHAGFRRALLRWMDRLPDGRPILRLDANRYAYVDVEDAHLLAVSARWDGDRVLLTLNDGSEAELDYASLRLGAGDAAYRIQSARAVTNMDTVPFGCFTRATWERVGGLNETLLGNEDYEFNYRVRRAGLAVRLDPAMHSTYVARSRIAADHAQARAGTALSAAASGGGATHRRSIVSAVTGRAVTHVR